jgi:hypothetical protein
MPLDFPTSPTLNEIYTFGGRSWIWNGTAWDVYSTTSVVNTLNGLTGTVGLSAGSNITVTSAGNTITISSSGSGGGISGPYVISFNGLTGSVQGVSSFNGLTGSVQGVSSIRGLTGTVGLTNGSGIGLSVSGNTLTVSNTGVLSIDGSTGAISNVARTNVNNNFSAPQTIAAAGAVFVIDDTLNSAGVTIDPVANDIIWRNGLNQSTLDFNPQGQVVTLPNITTTLAGLSGTQTFGGTKTFNALTTFNVGLSSAGGTFSGLVRFNAGLSASGITVGGSIVLQNQEFIQNTTNGRVDIMPAPTGSTHFGIYFDSTSWGFGVVLGTVRSSDNAINTGGNFRFDVPLTITADTRFQLGADGHYGFYRTDTGLNTGQLFALSNNANNSGAFALVNYFDVGAANRSPGTSHTHPNFYIYANGTTSPNDFIRFEHNNTNGNIVSGGTTGIIIQPGSGVVGISGGLSAAGGTFSALTRFTAGISAAGGTFSGTQTFINGATFQGNIIAPNIVTSFNGLTGAVTGVTTGTANNFIALQTFSAGISASGGVTLAGTVSSDTGYRISSSAFNTQTGTTYTFIAADNGEIVTFNNGSTITVTVPTGLPVGFNCTAIQLGVGQVGFTAASGVTLNAYASGLKIAGQHGSAALISYTSNVYNLSGTLTI